MQKTKPNISKVAFWDVNFDEIDFEKNCVFILEKVFNYGSFDDQIEVIRYYGIEKIKTEIIKIAYFRKEVLAFICSYFQINLTEFKCYLQRQSNPLLWEY